MENIIVRFFDKRNRKNSIELPITKKDISRLMYDNSFLENDFNISNVEVLGVKFDRLANNKDIVGFNLLAEKMEMLKKEELDKFRAVLNSKNVFIKQKLIKVDAIELCKVIDNLGCYKLHTSSQNLSAEQLVNCERITNVGTLEKVGEYENIDNSYIYNNYEMPEDEPVIELNIREFINEENYGREMYLVEFPLRNMIKNDFDFINSLDENKQYKITNSYYYNLDIYINYCVNKENLLEFNEFTQKFIKLDEFTKNKFKSVYAMYIWESDGKFENGVPINELNEISKNIDKFEFFKYEDIKELTVNAYLTEQGIDREFRQYVNYDKLFNEVVIETDFYKNNINAKQNTLYFVDKNIFDEYLRDEHEASLEEENDFEIDMDM